MGLLVLAASLGELSTAARVVLAAPQHLERLLQAWRDLAGRWLFKEQEQPLEERLAAPRRLAPLIPSISQAQAAVASKVPAKQVASA